MQLIIPIFNQPEYTHVCLWSLYKTLHGHEIKPIIVDSGSRRRTKDVIAEWVGAYKPFELLPPQVVVMAENKGFAAAVNAGLGVADLSTPVCIMHNDCVPFDGWAGEMMAVLGTTPDPIVAPRTNYSNELGPCVQELRQRFEKIKPSNKAKVSAAEAESLLQQCYGDGRQAVLNSLLLGPRTSTMMDISSFCLLAKSGTYSKYGLLDEDFQPRGFEDKFWFRGIANDGLGCTIANRAFVHHFGNITSDGPGFCFPDQMRENEERFRRKIP